MASMVAVRPWGKVPRFPPLPVVHAHAPLFPGRWVSVTPATPRILPSGIGPQSLRGFTPNYALH